MKVREVELRQLRMELRHPFETSFGVTRERRVTIVRVSDGGLSGYGEVTAAEGPFFSHETFDTAWHVLNDFIVPWALGREFDTAGELDPIVQPIRGHNMAKAGFENALWDLEARQKDLPLWKLLGGRRSWVECGVSIGIQKSVDVLLETIGRELDGGYRRIKIKIKPGWDLDVLGAVRSAFPGILLMVDANSAYTLADIDRLKKLDAFNLMMLEQPFHWEDMVDHAALQSRISTPVCLDETIHSAQDARKAIQIGACRIVNLKLGRVGGHVEARRVHDTCMERGIPVWCGGMLESGIGRAHNVALSTLENFSLPGDVSASSRYWNEDIVDPEITVTPDGKIIPPTGPGIGYRVRQDLIENLTTRQRTFSA